MNAQNFNFGPESRGGGLPTAFMGDRRDLVSGSAGVRIAEAAAGEPDGPNLRDEFFKYLGLALKHRWLILAGCVSGLVIGFLVTFTSTPIYRATATIKVDLDAAKVVKLDTVDNSGQVENAFRFYQTQKELLKSRSLAERVAGNLDLRDDDFVNQLAPARTFVFDDEARELRSRGLAWSELLASRVGEAVRMGVPHGDGILVVHHVFRPDATLQILEVGALLPLHATALGKALV